MPTVVWVGVVTLLAGCATYQPGSFTLDDRPFAGTRATLGCLDLSIERRADQGSSAVLDYQFGNRCERHTRIDLAGVRVVGRSSDGEEAPLAPYDPDFKLRALWLDGRRGGHEALEYPSKLPFAQVCVELTSITGRAAAPPAERWQCFARVELGERGELEPDDAERRAAAHTTARTTAVTTARTTSRITAATTDAKETP